MADDLLPRSSLKVEVCKSRMAKIAGRQEVRFQVEFDSWLNQNRHIVIIEKCHWIQRGWILEMRSKKGYLLPK